jgi:hypothetical protein
MCAPSAAPHSNRSRCIRHGRTLGRGGYGEQGSERGKAWRKERSWAASWPMKRSLHCRLHETCGNRFAIPIPFSIIQDERAIVCDVEVWQRFAGKRATYGTGQKPRAMEAQVPIDFKGLLTCSLEWPKTSIFGQIPCSHRLLAKKRVKFQLIVYKLLIY